MKKVIFSMALFAGNLLVFDAIGQVSVSVRMDLSIYCPPPPRVVVVSPPPPARIVVVKTSPVVTAPARPVVVMRPVPPPVYTANRPKRPIVVYR